MRSRAANIGSNGNIGARKAFWSMKCVPASFGRVLGSVTGFHRGGPPGT
jgi:hypothetical protein